MISYYERARKNIKKNVGCGQSKTKNNKKIVFFDEILNRGSEGGLRKRHKYVKVSVEDCKVRVNLGLKRFFLIKNAKVRVGRRELLK